MPIHVGNLAVFVKTGFIYVCYPSVNCIIFFFVHVHVGMHLIKSMYYELQIGIPSERVANVMS